MSSNTKLRVHKKVLGMQKKLDIAVIAQKSNNKILVLKFDKRCLIMGTRILLSKKHKKDQKPDLMDEIVEKVFDVYEL